MLEDERSVNQLKRSCEKTPFILLIILVFFSTPAAAHVSEQAFVLLLPTETYRLAGLSCVVASIIIVSLVSPAWMRAFFVPHRSRLR